MAEARGMEVRRKGTFLYICPAEQNAAQKFRRSGDKSAVKTGGAELASNAATTASSALFFFALPGDLEYSGLLVAAMTTYHIKPANHFIVIPPMLRRVLLACLPVFVATSCLRAQDTSPGNAQGCDPRELTELLTPADHAYAESVELTRELEHRGYIVRCVLKSKMENFFEGQLGAALYRTNRGDFEALFLTKPRTFDSVRVTERAVKGEFYRYSFEGSPHAGGMEGRRTFFARRANRFFMTFDMRLAQDLGEVLNSI